MENILTIQYADFAYKKDKIILKNINLSIKKGELILLVGENGSGKSTFLKTICKIIKLQAGKINILSQNINKYSIKDIAKIITIINHSNIAVNNMKVADFIALGRNPYTNLLGILGKIDKHSIENAAKMLNIERYLQQDVAKLSDGERQRANIARAIAQDTQIICFDEPTMFLDIIVKKEFLNILQLLMKENKTIIIATHDIGLFDGMDKKVAIIKNKTINLLENINISSKEIEKYMLDV